MKIKELTEPLGLEDRHFSVEKIRLPMIDSHLYTTLGRRLFEHYQRYNITPEDQREFERISFLLQSFVVSREQTSKTAWGRIRRLFRSNSGAISNK